MHGKFKDIMVGVMIPHLALFVSLDYYFLSLMTYSFLLIVQCYCLITHSSVIMITPPSNVVA